MNFSLSTQKFDDLLLQDSIAEEKNFLLSEAGGIRVKDLEDQALFLMIKIMV